MPCDGCKRRKAAIKRMIADCGRALPRILQALTGSESKDLRPLSQWDTENALFGLGQSRGDAPRQAVSWYASTTQRDRAPMPDEVVLPFIIGYNPIPLETPRYYRGSVFRDPDWEE